MCAEGEGVFASWSLPTGWFSVTTVSPSGSEAVTVGVEDWRWRQPVELQDVPWDCAAASLAWCLQAAGYPATEASVVAGLGPSRISPTYGLLDASGAGLVEYLGELGIAAENNPAATWSDMQAAAGYQPMLFGGRAWCHWSGVRMGTDCAHISGVSALALANPSPGYMGIEQVMDPLDFEQLGPFSAVWFIAW